MAGKRLIGSVVLGVTAPPVGTNPTPINLGQGIPAPIALAPTSYPAFSSMLDNDINFFQVINDQLVSFTHLVVSGDWESGQRNPSRIGGALPPTQGSLVINDRDGEFSVMNTNTLYSPFPGVEIQIFTRAGELLFKGWSGGVTNGTTSRDHAFSTMTLYGPMKRLEEFDEGFFALLNGTPTISEALELVLSQHAESSSIPRTIQPSTTRIYSTRVNRSGAFGSGRQRAKFRDALHLLAQLEGGRIYDDQRGFRFENFNSRYSYSGTVKALPDAQVVTTGALDASVINLIDSSADSTRVQGTGPVAVTAAGAPVDFPITYQVPPNTQGWALVFELADDSIEFMESWETPERGVDYLYTGDAPLVQHDARAVRWVFDNNTSATKILTINQIRGEAIRVTATNRFYERSQRSINRYGPKAVVYPSELLVDQESMRARLLEYLELYDGISEDGEIDPLISLQVTLLDPTDIYYVSDLVTLDWETPWARYALDHPFWVDAVKYTYSSDRTLSVELSLFDAWTGNVRRDRRRHIGGVTVPPVPLKTLIGRVNIIRHIGSVYLRTLIGSVQLPDVTNLKRLIGSVELPRGQPTLGVALPAPSIGFVAVPQDDFSTNVEALIGFPPRVPSHDIDSFSMSWTAQASDDSPIANNRLYKNYLPDTVPWNASDLIHLFTASASAGSIIMTGEGFFEYVVRTNGEVGSGAGVVTVYPVPEVTGYGRYFVGRGRKIYQTGTSGGFHGIPISWVEGVNIVSYVLTYSAPPDSPFRDAVAVIQQFDSVSDGWLVEEIDKIVSADTVTLMRDGGDLLADRTVYDARVRFGTDLLSNEVRVRAGVNNTRSTLPRPTVALTEYRNAQGARTWNWFVTPGGLPSGYSYYCFHSFLYQRRPPLHDPVYFAYEATHEVESAVNATIIQAGDVEGTSPRRPPENTSITTRTVYLENATGFLYASPSVTVTRGGPFPP